MKTYDQTLYYSPGACSLAIHIVLEEIGKPFNLKLIVTDKGEASMPEFRRLNDKGRIPVLLDHGSIWTEAPAILLHLALAHPESGLAPKGSGELCRTVEWFNWLSGTVHSTAVRLVWRPESFTTEPDRRDGIIKKGREQIDEAFNQFQGDFYQTPPMVSAIKKDGVPLYKLARQGKTVEREPRLVHIYGHEILKVDLPEVEFRVVCSKGF
jgi:glutathione S-transferase